MDYNIISPYIRKAERSVIKAPFTISERIILDYELIYVKEGKCYLTFDNQKHLCEKDDIIFIRPNILHRFDSFQNTDFHQPHIHFDMVFDEKSKRVFICFQKYEALSEENKKLCRNDIVDIDIPIVIRSNENKELESYFFDIINDFSNNDIAYEMSTKAKLITLLGKIFARYDKNINCNVKKTDLEITNIKNFIDANFSNKITLDSLSSQFYINKFKIVNEFKRLYGQTPIRYYNQKRIEFAKKLLRADTSVTEIANILSCDSIYTFSRFFKTITGISPTKYKAEISI